MYSKMVRDFAEKAEAAALPKGPVLLRPEAIAFLKTMVADELEELAEANTIADQADALVDAIYYILHSAAKHGMNLDSIFSIVHAANMDKLRGGVRRRADGKIMKPSDWQPPDEALNREIAGQLENGSFPSSNPSSEKK